MFIPAHLRTSLLALSRAVCQLLNPVVMPCLVQARSPSLWQRKEVGRAEVYLYLPLIFHYIWSDVY